MDQLRSLLPSLRSAVAANTAAAPGLLQQCRVLLIELPSAQSATAAASEDELALTREVLELSVQHAIAISDWRSFELQVTQALPLYTQGAHALTPAARESWRLLTGLQLMHLLVEARLSDFHCKVEALREEDTASPSIAFPLSLEAFLLEGGYNKILNSTLAAPSDLFKPFLARLVGTVRDDIADCAAAAYPSLAVADALQMLRLAGGEGALASYIEQRALPWAIEGGRVTLAQQEKAQTLLQAATLLSNTLGYAAELEKIV